MNSRIEKIAGNIRWSQKIYLLMAIFGIGVFVVGGVGSMGIQYLSTSFQEGVGRAKQGLNAAMTARVSTLSMDQALYRLISSNESDDIRASAIAAIKGASYLEESLQQLTASLPSDSKVVELLAINEKIKPLRMEVIRNAKNNLDSEAIGKLKEINQSLQTIDRLTSEILDQEQLYLQQLATDNAGRARQTVLLLAGVIVAGGILLTLIAIVLKNLLTRPLNRMENSIKQVAEGNLQQEVGDYGEDEVGKALEALAKTLDSLNRMVFSIRSRSQEVSTQAQALAGLANESSAMETTLQAAVGSVHSASAQVLSATNQSADHLHHAIASAQATASAVESNVASMQIMINDFDSYQSRMHSSVEVAQELVQSVQEITNITQTINGIAYQTNLLALNAAIEAARAGEQGRGFAVVADEVRKLADSTGNATKKIQSIALRITSNADQTAKALQESAQGAGANGQRLKVIADEINRASAEAVVMRNVMRTVEDLMNEQHSSVSNIEGNVNSLSNVASRSGQQSAALLALSDELRDTAHELQDMMSRFRLRQS